MSQNPAPMSTAKRMYGYWATNGVPAGGKLTPRQRRRFKHKSNRAMAPFGKRDAAE